MGSILEMSRSVVSDLSPPSDVKSETVGPPLSMSLRARLWAAIRVFVAAQMSRILSHSGHAGMLVVMSLCDVFARPFGQTET